jgi:hypothetical protein
MCNNNYLFSIDCYAFKAWVKRNYLEYGVVSTPCFSKLSKMSGTQFSVEMPQVNRIAELVVMIRSVATEFFHRAFPFIVLSIN